MSTTAIFVIGAVVTALCIAFVWISHYEMKHLSKDPEESTHAKSYL